MQLSLTPTLRCCIFTSFPARKASPPKRFTFYMLVPSQRLRDAPIKSCMQPPNEKKQNKCFYLGATFHNSYFKVLYFHFVFRPISLSDAEFETLHAGAIPKA